MRQALLGQLAGVPPDVVRRDLHHAAARAEVGDDLVGVPGPYAWRVSSRMPSRSTPCSSTARRPPRVSWRSIRITAPRATPVHQIGTDAPRLGERARAALDLAGADVTDRTNVVRSALVGPRRRGGRSSRDAVDLMYAAGVEGPAVGRVRAVLRRLMPRRAISPMEGPLDGATF